MADIRCPMCGHTNPEGTLNCDNCDARLVPMGTLGGETPQRDDANQMDQDDLGILLDNIIDEGTDHTADPLDSEILSWLDDDQPERKGEVSEELPSFDALPVEDRLSSLLNDIEPPLDEKIITDWLDTSIVEDESTGDIDEDWLAVASEDLGKAEESDDDLLPSWLEDVESTESTVEIVSTDIESEEEQDIQPEWMTESIIDESVSTEETMLSGGEEKDSPILPDWIVDAPGVDTGELNVSQLEENDDELPKWFTQELDSSVLGDESEEKTEADIQEPHVNTGALPWMEDVSDSQSEKQDEPDFDLPVSESFTLGSTDDEESFDEIKKVTTSSLPWMTETLDEEEKPESEESPASVPAGTTSILDRFADTLSLAKDESPDISESFNAEESEDDFLSVSDDFMDDVILAVDDVSIPDVESPIMEDQPAVEEPLPESVDGVSIEELLFEEEIQSIEPPPKENYANAVPEEEGKESWSDFLGSEEFAPSEEELPDWFSQTTDDKTPSDMLREIGADENPIPVPVDEPEEEPEEKTGSVLGFLKGLRSKKDEQESEVVENSEIMSSVDSSDDVEEEDWDLPEWVVAEEATTEEAPTFEITDELMDGIQDAVPASELPDWLAEAEDKSEIPSIEEPVDEPIAIEEPSGGDSVDEISEEDHELGLESFFEEIEFSEEETSIEEMVDGFFDGSEEEIEAVKATSEEPDIEDVKIITDALAVAGLPEWLDDNVTLEDSEEPREDDLAEQPESATKGLPQFMHDDMDFVDIHQNIVEEDELSDQVVKEEPAADAAETAVLPNWLSDMPDEEPETDLTKEEPEIEAAETTGLPDWLSDMPDEEPEAELAEAEPALEAPEIDVDPNWLLDISNDEPEPELTKEEPESEVADTTGLPDWLAELPDQEPGAELEVEKPVVEAVDFEALTVSMDDISDEQPIASNLDEVLAETDDEVDASDVQPEWFVDDSSEDVEPESLVSELEIEQEEIGEDEDTLPGWMVNPEESHGQTGELLDSLATGTLPVLDDLDETSDAAPADLPDWLTSVDSQSVEEPEEQSFFNELDISSETVGEEILTPDAATVELGDIASTQALPEWLSDIAPEEDEEESVEAVVAPSDEFPVELADFISTDEALPDWMETIAAEEEPVIMQDSSETEGEEVFESIFGSDAEVPGQDLTDLAVDDLENEDEKIIQHPGATDGLPDWLSEYSEEEDESAAPAKVTDELDDWLVAKDAEDEDILDLFGVEDAQADTLEPVVVTDTGELNTWIEDHGIQPEEDDAEKVDQDEVVSIDVEKDLPDWVLDLEPDEAAPLEREPSSSDTASLPEWMVSDAEPEIEETDNEIEVPPMEEGLFDFIKEEASEEESDVAAVSMSLGTLDFEESPEFDGDSEFNAEEFDMSSFEAAFAEDAEDNLFETHESEPEENVSAEDLFGVAAAASSFEEFNMGEDEESPFDISALENVEENYTPDVGLEEQSDWLGEYADQGNEDLSEETSISTSPFSISLEDEEFAEAEGVAVAEELPEWVDKIDSEDDDGIWDQPLEALAAISSTVQTSFDQEQPDIDYERRNIELMERILLSEKGTVQTHRPRRRTRELTLRLMLTVLVVVAVLAGLFSMMPPLPNFIHNAPTAVVQFEQQIRYYQQIASDKPVLVVFDYQPAYQGEMMVYAELPLKSLMENNARIFTFSTIPEGPALSQKMMMDVVFQNGLQYNTQSQAVPLGYLPGGSAAIRDFSVSMRSTVHGLDAGSSGTYIWDLPMASDVDSLDDFAMVLVLTDDLDKARLWIEQATIYLTETTPMMMITSARISPMLKPYLLSEQLDGLIGGTVDTAAYGTLANQVGSYLYYWRAYQLGIYLMVFTIMAGAVLQILRQVQRALPKRGDK